MGTTSSKVDAPEEASAVLGGQQYDSVSTAAPVGQEMDTPPNVNPLLEQLLRDREIIDIRVNGNQCCRMCFCQPEAEWTINKRSPSQAKALYSDIYDTGLYDMGAVVGTIEEESPWIGRCFSFIQPGSRPIKYVVKEGGPGGSVVLTHEKGCSLGQSCFFVTFTPHPMSWFFGIPFRVPLCCCLPYMNTSDAHGKVIATSQVLCDHNFCVPKIAVEVEGRPVYVVTPDTCAFGCCAVCTCDAPGQTSICLRSPFFVRSAITGEKLVPGRIRDPRTQEQLVKMGMFVRSNLYTVEFPPLATVNEKAALMGSVLLMDNSLFEQDTNLLG